MLNPGSFDDGSLASSFGEVSLDDGGPVYPRTHEGRRTGLLGGAPQKRTRRPMAMRGDRHRYSLKPADAAAADGGLDERRAQTAGARQRKGKLALPRNIASELAVRVDAAKPRLVHDVVDVVPGTRKIAAGARSAGHLAGGAAQASPALFVDGQALLEKLRGCHCDLQPPPKPDRVLKSGNVGGNMGRPATASDAALLELFDPRKRGERARESEEARARRRGAASWRKWGQDSAFEIRKQERLFAAQVVNDTKPRAWRPAAEAAIVVDAAYPAMQFRRWRKIFPRVRPLVSGPRTGVDAAVRESLASLVGAGLAADGVEAVLEAVADGTAPNQIVAGVTDATTPDQCYVMLEAGVKTFAFSTGDHARVVMGASSRFELRALAVDAMKDLKKPRGRPLFSGAGTGTGTGTAASSLEGSQQRSFFDPAESSVYSDESSTISGAVRQYDFKPAAKRSCDLLLRASVVPEDTVGCPLVEVRDVLTEARAAGAHVIGVAVDAPHLVTGDPKDYFKVLRAARHAMDLGIAMGFPFSLLDLGTGFPPFAGGIEREMHMRGDVADATARVTCASVAAVINPMLDKLFPKSRGFVVTARPGCFFVDGSCVALARVVATSPTPASAFGQAGLDVTVAPGAFSVLEASMLAARVDRSGPSALPVAVPWALPVPLPLEPGVHPDLWKSPSQRRNGQRDVSCVVRARRPAGSATADVVHCTNVCLPASLAPGDWLCFPRVGNTCSFSDSTAASVVRRVYVVCDERIMPLPGMSKRKFGAAIKGAFSGRMLNKLAIGGTGGVAESRMETVVSSDGKRVS